MPGHRRPALEVRAGAAQVRAIDRSADFAAGEALAANSELKGDRDRGDERIEPMSDFSTMLALQLGAMLLMGMPVALALAAQDRSSVAFGSLLLAPAFGVTLYLGLATGLHFLGLGSSSILPTLLSLACRCLSRHPGAFRRASRLRQASLGPDLDHEQGQPPSLPSIPSIFARSASMTHFPLTNADTFVVLGNIDRIPQFRMERSEASLSRRIYPA